MTRLDRVGAGFFGAAGVGVAGDCPTGAKTTVWSCKSDIAAKPRKDRTDD
jgi:hypothetical protein